MALIQRVFFVVVFVSSVVGQDVSPTPEECFSAGSVAGAVIGTLLVTLALAAIAFLVWKFYWKSRRGKHLVLVTDTEAGADQYAFDNPCFRDGTPIGRTPPEKEPVKLDQKARWSAWSPIGALVASRNEKRRALDDSFVGEPQVQTVSLRSHDFTGLGFNICGNMRDGIFVKDVLHRGPASESGRISPGDRIDAIRISFRHMVFEDALTILSYASPYEVQLEVENAATSRPSTLIRTKRTSASNIAPADRICHPFYRSQSIADLAQIGKASLKRVQQMGGGINKSPHMSKGDPFDELGDYPTLKLPSSSPISTPQKRENIHVGKASTGSSPQVTGSSPQGTAIVKPERAKRTTPRNSISSPEESEGKADTLSRFQKFGVRVLPDPATPRTSDVQKQTAAEAERHQNEQNIMRERVGSASQPKSAEISLNPFSTHKTTIDPTPIDTVDGGKSTTSSFFYDERGIDVGPVEKLPAESSGPGEEISHATKLTPRATSPDEETDVNKESHVKHLLTKGLQNLKEKLHNDKRKSPESPRNTQDEKQKQGRKHKVSMSSDSEGVETDKPKEAGIRYKINPKEDLEKRAERRRQRNPEKDGLADQTPLPPDENIPTEIPEEVRRAAVAARSNRKSLGSVALPDLSKEIPDKGTNVSRESMSDSSSDCDVPTGIASDSLGRPPKRSNKRKAPPPPPEDADDSLKPTTEDDASKIPDKLGFDAKVLGSWENNTSGNEIETSKWSKKTFGNPNPNHNNENSNSSESGKIITTFANMARQRTNPEPSKKDITNITIDDGSSHILSTYTSRRVSEGNENISPQGNAFPMDSSSSGTSTMETKTVDYDEGVHVHTINSDSDSDLERLEGDDDEFEGKRNKKGGTTIELNSSHITIHHSPSSGPDLESDSTRKAASLGDLSRLDTEQPMSILERAVSLDLADGGTPLGTKKRKAPPPPPGEEYLTSTQDSEEGVHYRKEPRLDAAMDTLQRRRLKKSSEWGTMEEALKQTENSLKIEPAEERFSTEKSSPKPIGQTTSLLEMSKDIAMELPATSQKAEDTSVKANLAVGSVIVSDIISSNVATKDQDMLPHSGKSDTTTTDHTTITSSKVKLSPEKEKLEDLDMSTDKMIITGQQQKTVLHISPEVTREHDSSPASSTSQVSISPSSRQLASSGDFVEHERLFSETQREQKFIRSPEHLHISNIVSSTPLTSRELSSSLTSHREQVQSPLVTSSDAGISSIHVISSSQDLSLTPSEIDSSILVTSATDPFVTAASIVDSTITTTMTENVSDDEGTWEPPELPTSPVPVLSPTPSSTFNASPSMTYITEIQVVTTTDGETDHNIGSSTTDVASNGSAVTSTYTQGARKYRSDSSLSSDSITSDRDDKDPATVVTGTQHSTATTTTTTTTVTASDGTLGQPLRSNVSVTSIRTSTLTNPAERPKVLAGTELFTSGLSEGTELSVSNIEKKPKSVRPPVPPRKSESSSSSMSSTIMVEVPKMQLAETTSSSLLAGGTVTQGSPGGGKFISFSSLAPRHSSSFEQWVFLDEANTGNRLNGIEGASNSSGGESEGGNNQGLGASRAQTITHIILDTKQKSGGQVKQ